MIDLYHLATYNSSQGKRHLKLVGCTYFEFSLQQVLQMVSFSDWGPKVHLGTQDLTYTQGDFLRHFKIGRKRG